MAWKRWSDGISRARVQIPAMERTDHSAFAAFPEWWTIRAELDEAFIGARAGPPAVASTGGPKIASPHPESCPVSRSNLLDHKNFT